MYSLWSTKRRSVLWSNKRSVCKMRKGDSYTGRLLGGSAPASCVGQPKQLLLQNGFNSLRTHKGKNWGCKPGQTAPGLHLCHKGTPMISFRNEGANTFTTRQAGSLEPAVEFCFHSTSCDSRGLQLQRKWWQRTGSKACLPSHTPTWSFGPAQHLCEHPRIHRGRFHSPEEQKNNKKKDWKEKNHWW